MEGHAHHWIPRAAGATLSGCLMVAAMPAAQAVAMPPAHAAAMPPAHAADITTPAELPACAVDEPAIEPAVVDDHAMTGPWQAELDADGVVIGYRLGLRLHGVEREVRAGRRSFAESLAGDRLLIGERGGGTTALTLVDLERGCTRWRRTIDGMAYPLPTDRPGTQVRLTIHAAGTRAWQGTVQLETETGSTEAMIDGDCSTNCQPGDDDIPIVAFEPAGVARPVPNFPGGGWAKDKSLPFRWKSGAVPPAWAKPPLRAAATDVVRTAQARSPRFMPRTGAPNSVHYGGVRPRFCGGIACASRSLPADFWAVWIRPHGTDFGWGTLRWCQRSSGSGCFDLRRVMLHELGHVSGLDHPESGGFRLGPWETVMHAITPAKPTAGSKKHSFGRCDVATLQELYDVPTNRTPISRCNDVESRLELAPSRATVAKGATVRLIATLRIAGRSAYRQLAGNPLNGRTVKLKYRRSGSTGPWTTLPMSGTGTGGRYEATISPGATWEYKAVFPAPDDEGLRYSRSETVKVRVQG